jgi:hypothetical protein
MNKFYNYDTRGASTASQIINLERMVQERDAEIERLRSLVEAKDLLLSEWLGEEKAQSEIERLREELRILQGGADLLSRHLMEQDDEIERLCGLLEQTLEPLDYAVGATSEYQGTKAYDVEHLPIKEKTEKLIWEIEKILAKN